MRSVRVVVGAARTTQEAGLPMASNVEVVGVIIFIMVKVRKCCSKVKEKIEDAYVERGGRDLRTYTRRKSSVKQGY